MKHKIGAKVIITTCNGEFRGKVQGYSKSFSGDTLYKVSGPKIISTVRNAVVDTGQKLNTQVDCSKCPNPCTIY